MLVSSSSSKGLLGRRSRGRRRQALTLRHSCAPLLLRSFALLAASPVALLAQEAEGGGTRTFMKPDTGLMVWTLIIFVVLMFVLSRYAFGPLTKRRRSARAVAAGRASTPRSAIATRRPSCSSEHQAQDRGRSRRSAEAHRRRPRASPRRCAPTCSSRRARSSRTCSSAPAETSRARRTRRSPQLRREAVDLALAGASKVIEQNLESQKNRQLVESYLVVARHAQGRASNARADDRQELRRDAARARAAGGRPARLGRDDRPDRRRDGDRPPACGVSRVAARERAAEERDSAEGVRRPAAAELRSLSPGARQPPASDADPGDRARVSRSRRSRRGSRARVRDGRAASRRRGPRRS